MADIKCPHCDGFGRCRCIDPKVREFACPTCEGRGTIPDRRSPTANDRVVARIKDLTTTPAVHMTKFGPGATSMALWFLDIINEEAERG